MDIELKPLIHCGLCKTTLKDPRNLPCLHTFCRSCIDDDIRKRNKSETSRTYYCPICSRVTKFPNDVTMKHWGEHLPKNKLASNVIDGYNLKTGKVNCKPCNRKQKSAPATQWCIKCKEPLCDACVESHSSFKTTMGHEITDLAKLKNQPLKELLIPPPCEEHQEDLDHYCYDHKEFVCNSCKASTHRSCKSVFLVSVHAERIRNDSKTLSHSLGQHEKNAKILLENRESEKEMLEVTKSKLKEQIMSVRGKINDILTKYENQSLKEVDDICLKEKQVLDTDVQGVKGIYNTSHNMHSVLKAASKHANDVHFIQWQNKIEKEAQMLNDMIFDIHEPLTSSRVTFTINDDLEKITKSLRNLGDLSIKKENVNLITGLGKVQELMQENKNEYQDNVSMLSYQLPLQQFSVETKTDEHASFITGMVMLPNNILVCADKNNSKLKVFDAEFQMQNEHELEFSPFDVTIVGKNKVAATIPSQSVISIFSIGSSIQLKTTIATKDSCYGIAYSNKRFAYTCPFAKDTCVKMITDNGEAIMTICPEVNFQSLFLRPWYVKFDNSGSHLYVSDCHRAQIYCCVGTTLRRFVYSHDRLNAPRGLVMRKNDDFFVVGWGSDNIHFIDHNGRFIREVVNRWNGSFSPQTVCLTSNEDSLIVSLDPTSCNSNTLLVFELPEEGF